jgi:ubiquitin carboxyl-terminal hydrolase 36/42
MAGVKPVSETSIPVAVASESSGANHTVTSLNGKKKDTPFQVVSTTAEVPENGNSDSVDKPYQSTPQVASFDSKRTKSNIKPTNFVDNGSYTKNLDEISVHKSQTSAPNMSGFSSFIHEDLSVHSKEHGGAQDGDDSEDCSRVNHTRKPADKNNAQAAATVVPAPNSYRTSLRVEVEQCKTKATGTTTNNIESSKFVPSVVAADKVTSIQGGRSVTSNPSKRADNPSDRAGSTANSLATSLKKIVRQQTAPKVVRHYPSELVIEPSIPA